MHKLHGRFLIVASLGMLGVVYWGSIGYSKDYSVCVCVCVGVDSKCKESNEKDHGR